MTIKREKERETQNMTKTHAKETYMTKINKERERTCKIQKKERQKHDKDT